MTKKLQTVLLLIFMASVVILSRIGAKDPLVHFLESVPVIIGFVLILFTWKRFPLTPLLMILIAIHSAILCYGARYTYAETPLGFWFRDLFGFARNHYDRLGHLAQGFIPAILAREILIRRKVIVQKPVWTFLLATSVCLAFSAFYEMIEWWVAVASDGGSPEFLGTQGDVWDTQWDMFLALVGAIVSQLLLFRFHDRQIQDVERSSSPR